MPSTVPELLDLLGSSGVLFGRWVRQAPYRPQCGIMGELPHGSRLADMAEVDQYTAMELFRGTIARHSLIAYRDDSPLPVRPIVWSGEAWRGYVPIVPTPVVVVEDRLPPGKAAAVINRAHVDHDLVCFIDEQELAAFRTIDGATPLSALAGASPGFFERLWLHDLVIIDASVV